MLKRSHTQIWLLVIGLSTLIIGACYAMVQQSTRLAANDLPLATAQTVKHQLNAAVPPANVISSIKADLSSDSVIFVIVTDTSQHILANSAQLNGQPAPLPPSGVFSYAKAHGTDIFSWQPASDARLATVVMSYGSSSEGGFIISGQSLQPAENRINTYGQIALAAWLGIIIWTSVVLYWSSRRLSKAKK